MKLDVTAALKSRDLPVKFTCSVPLGRVSVGGETVEFTSAVVIKGELSFAGEEFWVRGGLSGQYTACCARCTEELSTPLVVEFEEEFARQADEEKPDRYLFEGDTIDLHAMLDDLVTLNIPMRHLCREDCRGLCPVCGSNLNQHICNCIVEEELPANPFDALKGLLDDENEEV